MLTAAIIYLIAGMIASFFIFRKSLKYGITMSIPAVWFIVVLWPLAITLLWEDKK